MEQTRHIDGKPAEACLDVLSTYSTGFRRETNGGCHNRCCGHRVANVKKGLLGLGVHVIRVVVVVVVEVGIFAIVDKKRSMKNSSTNHLTLSPSHRAEKWGCENGIYLSRGRRGVQHNTMMAGTYRVDKLFLPGTYAAHDPIEHERRSWSRMHH